MLQFCINTIHSCHLTLSHNSERKSESFCSSSSSSHCRNILLGLRILIGEIQKPSANVLVIRRVITIKMKNQDSSFLGFLGSSAGSVMESMSTCTESLGFESSNQLEEEDVNQERLLSSSTSSSLNTTTSSNTGLARSRLRRRIMIENERRMIDKRSEQVKNKIFPPPLSSLNQNGHRKFYLKSERENGRLQITVKKINRPEFLRASRQDGRLTLHLMKPSIPGPGPVSEIESKDETELKESEEELNGLNGSKGELNGLKESGESVEEEVEVNKKDKEIEVSANGGGGGGGGASDESWKFLLGNGGGESHRRCYDLSHHYHHHRVPIWSNHYVLTG